jgi:medium-chain acyl-[acyl-carrier-protein] hydrolase
MQENSIPLFVKDYEIRYKEVNDRQEITPVAVLNFVEETAADHCAYIGRNVFDLQKEGIGWVLYAGCFHMDHYPRYREKIKIVTWISEFKGFRGYREYKVLSENDELYGGFRGMWLYFDLVKRKPILVDKIYYELWPVRNVTAIDCEIKPYKNRIEKPDFQEDFPVLRYDIDSNDHVNNVRYMQWLMESIPDEFYNNARMEYIQGTFLKETFYKRHVLTECKILSPTELIHTVSERENGILLATAKTTWTWD